MSWRVPEMADARHPCRVHTFRNGDLVGFAGPVDAAVGGLEPGEPGAVIDVNGPQEITVSFVHGPSASLPAEDLELLADDEWQERKRRMSSGLPARG